MTRHWNVRFALLLILALTAPSVAEEPSLRSMLDQVEGLQNLIQFARPAANATVRYPNGQIATNLYGSATATWRWPNGQNISLIAGRPTATWYWPNGKIMTNLIGSKTATWYWPDGQIMLLNGGGFSEAELQDTPNVAAQVLRMALRRGF